jgi:hypothetical protein
MCHTMFPETKITTNHLEEQLKETTLEQHGNDLVKVFTDMEDLRLKIEAEKGHAYDTDRYMTLIFSKLENYKQPDFLFDLCAMAEVISSLKGTYKNLLVDKKWDKMDSSEEQIIALTTQVKQLKKAAPKVDGSGNNTKKVVANTSGKPGGAGGAKGTITSSGIKAKAPAWQITKAGATITHPDHGYDMVWCPEHVSKCGTVNGMYMKARTTMLRGRRIILIVLTLRKLLQRSALPRKNREVLLTKSPKDPMLRNYPLPNPSGQPSLPSSSAVKLMLSKSLKKPLLQLAPPLMMISQKIRSGSART